MLNSLILSEKQWRKLVPVIRSGARALEISVDNWGNAMIEAVYANATERYSLKSNIVPLPLPHIEGKHPKEEKSLGTKAMHLVNRLGLVIMGTEDKE